MTQYNWPVLANSPIEVALFQIKYDIGQHSLDDFLALDSELHKTFPIRKDDFSANFNFGNSRIPLGESKVSGTSNAKLTQYTYISADQKSKLAITVDTITYIEEHKYQNWDEYIETINKYLKLLSAVLGNNMVNRTSIRFINRFRIDGTENIVDYFNTTISTKSDDTIPYSVQRFAHRIQASINENCYCVINQSLDKPTDKYEYVFDIDVLDRSQIVFDLNSINNILNGLRVHKNTIFFRNLTDKALELCN